MDTNELMKWLLANGIPDSKCRILEEEEIDEEAFIELEESEIKEMIPQTGIVKKLKKLQEKLKKTIATSKPMDEELFALSYEGQSCSLLAIPQPNNQLVLSAAEKLGQDLPIDILGDQLSSLAIFIRLANCGVKGNVQLEIEVRRVLRDVVSLCDETIHTLNDFKRASNISLETMQSAYGFLKDGLEDQALMMLKRLKETSKKMIDASSSLSKRCKKESEEIEKVGDMTMIEKDYAEKEIRSQEAVIIKSKAKEERNKKQAREASESVKETKERLKKGEKQQEENYKLRLAMITEKENKLKEINESLESKIKNLHSSHAENEKLLDNSLITHMKEEQSELAKRFDLNQQTYEEAIKANEQTFASAIEHNKLELHKRREDNKQWHEDELSKINKKYRECTQENEDVFDKKCTSIEQAYTDAGRQSAHSYEEALQRNTERLKLGLKQAQTDYETLLTNNENDLMDRLKKSETNFTEALNNTEGNPALAIPVEITEENIKTKISSIEQDYQDQLKQNKTRYNNAKTEIEREFGRKKRQAEEEKDSELKTVSESHKEDEQSHNEQYSSVKMPEREGFFSSLYPIGKEQRNKEYEEKVEAAKNKKQNLIAAYQTREKSRADSKKSAESAYYSSVADYERQKHAALSQLNDEKLFWDNQARQERDNAKAKVHSEKQNRDTEIATIKSQRLAANTQLKAKQEESRSSLHKLKSDNDAKANKSKSQKEMQANEERLKQDKEASFIRDEAMDKADKKRREDIRIAEKEKANANKVAANEKDDEHEDKSKHLKAENEKAESEKIEADSLAKKVKQDADKHALDIKLSKNKEAELVANRKLVELKEKHQKQKDEAKAQLLQKLEDTTALLEKEKTEIDQTTASKLDVQKEIQDKLQNDEEKQETKVEKVKRKKEQYEKKMAEAAMRMQEAVKQKHIKTSAKDCLDEAITALRAVGDTMEEAENFWREMNALCSYVADEKLMAQVENIDNSDKKARLKIWTSQTFKSDALQFYLKWTALKEICGKACKSVGYAKTDAHKYVREHPGEKEALQLVEKLGNFIQQKALTHSENTTASSCGSITDGVKTKHDIDTSRTVSTSTKSNDNNSGMQEMQEQTAIPARSSTCKAASKIPVSDDSSDINDSSDNNKDTDTDENNE